MRDSREDWFERTKWLYVPTCWQGWTVIAFAIGFLLHVFVAIDRNSHSVSDTLYAFFPYAISTFLLYAWIAERSSQQRTGE